MGQELGNFKILNVTKTLLAGTEDTFTFSVPPGGVGELKEATFHVQRASALSEAGEGGSKYTSELVIVKSLEVIKSGESERKNLLSGTPNIKEFAGDGKLSKLFTVIEVLENNEDVLITVRNNDSASVAVSLTLWLKVIPRARDIAGQPAERIPAVQRGA